MLEKVKRINKAWLFALGIIIGAVIAVLCVTAFSGSGNNPVSDVPDIAGVSGKPEGTNTLEPDLIEDLNTPEAEPPVPQAEASPKTVSYEQTPSDLRPASEMQLVPPSMVMPFPDDTDMPEGAESVWLKDRGGYGVQVYPDVLYDTRDGEELVLQILVPLDPMAMFGGSSKTWPLVMYIPGSAWMRQNVYASFSNMLRIAEKGFAVAIVEYRGTDISQFPSAIEDTKTAIRFMKTNAELYGIDVSKMAVWGDSSGGHTAVMAAITDDSEFNTGIYGDVSASVNAIVDWYGPTDISLMGYYPSMMDHTLPNSPEGMLLGGVNVLENPELAQKANPLNYLSEDKDTPPMLIMHGSQDSIVPFNQSVRLYEKMRELNKDAIFYKVEGGSHGSGGFMGDEILNMVADFLTENLT